MAMAKEDVEATMTLLLLRGEVALGATENGAKIHGPYDLPPKIRILRTLSLKILDLVI